MIQEIENRRSIRKYKADKINKELIEDMIYSATLAPSAKKQAALEVYCISRQRKREIG